MDRRNRTNPNQDDPYFAVKEEVEWAIEQAMDRHENVPVSRKWTVLEAADMELMELEKAVQVMVANPARFQLDGQEVNRRKEETKHMRQRIESLKKMIESKGNAAPSDSRTEVSIVRPNRTANTSGNQDGNMPFTRAFSPTLPPGNDWDEGRREEGAWEKNNNGDHVALLRAQDGQLDALGEQVTRIGFLGKEIGSELEMQNSMLEDLDVEMDGVHGRMTQARRIIAKLTRGTRRGSFALICILIALLVVLIVLVMR